MPISDLSPVAVQQALTRYQGLFERGDVEAIIKDFADDVRVTYGPFSPFTGKEKLRSLLQQRFARMRDYRLVKRLEFVCPPRFAASWTGIWVDVSSGVKMEVFGLEVLTLKDGKFSEWSAGVSTWPLGEAQKA